MRQVIIEVRTRFEFVNAYLRIITEVIKSIFIGSSLLEQ